jgi:GTP cyclohydrolase I
MSIQLIKDLEEDDEPGEGLGLEEVVREMLLRIGEDPTREGLLKTPSRVDKAMAFLTSGYRADIEKIVNGAIFQEDFARDSDEVVLVRGIEFYSMCEHHMIPFFGTIHVAYIPERRVIGLSKIPRIIDVFARRLQVQERMTKQIAECIQQVLQPRGVAVVAEAKHMCMCMRGVQKQNSSTTTTTMLGTFRERPELRNEFYGLLRGTM